MKILLACANETVVTRWTKFVNGQNTISHAATTEAVLSLALTFHPQLCMLHQQIVSAAVCRDLHSRLPDSKLFILSDNPNADEGVEYLKCGAVGYGNTYISQTRLAEALHVIVSAGGVWLGQLVMQKLIVEAADAAVVRNGAELEKDQRFAGLTPTERTVAKLVARGMTNLAIAAELTIAERTVKAHLSSVYDKLKVGNRLSLALLINRG